MKLYFKDTYQFTTRTLLRKCGYSETSNQEGVVSYVRIFGPGGYPRFHCYIENAVKGFQVNLHLDQKRPVYAGGTAHSGEYEGKVVEHEAARMVRIIQGLKR